MDYDSPEILKLFQEQREILRNCGTLDLTEHDKQFFALSAVCTPHRNPLTGEQRMRDALDRCGIDYVGREPIPAPNIFYKDKVLEPANS